MSRYDAQHKAATRRRIIESAGRRFKRDGIDGSGIATLVADAGLTNGAFYRHFTSKDDLVASVVADQLAEQVATVEALPPGATAIEVFLREYLSPAHRDDRAGGCPSAALLDEISRCDQATRQAYTDGARAMIDAITHHLDGEERQGLDDRAITLFTLLVGSVQLARAVMDPGLSERVLATALAHATVIAGQAESPGPALPPD